MDRDLHRALAHAELRRDRALGAAVAGEPGFEQLEMLRLPLLRMLRRERRQGEGENGEPPLPVEPRIRRRRVGDFQAGRSIRAGGERHMLVLRAALRRAETVARVGEVVLHRAEQVGAEPPPLAICAAEHRAREHAREKLLREIARVAEIVRSAGDVSVDGRVVSRAQIAQRSTRLRVRTLRREHLRPACRGEEIAHRGASAPGPLPGSTWTANDFP